MNHRIVPQRSVSRSLLKGSFLLGLIAFMSACIVEPREGYWDHDHHRWYHEHSWHECMENDMHCH